jgi:hypothetical protein
MKYITCRLLRRHWRVVVVASCDRQGQRRVRSWHGQARPQEHLRRRSTPRALANAAHRRRTLVGTPLALLGKSQAKYALAESRRAD